MANEATKFTINGVQHDVMDVGARQLIANVQAAINAITSGDTTTAIKTFQEVINFLDGVTDNETLAGKLNELRTLINGKYAKPANGIPSSDLVQSVQDILSDVANKVDKVNGKGLSTNDYTTEEKTKLAGLPTNPVQSISVNGGTAQTPTNGNVNIQVQGAQVTVTTNNDGTFTIHSGDNDYTINLNHTHENMAKLVVCEESDLPSTLDPATIYAQVDDADTPTEIQSLWIAGLEFVGGGAAPGTPRLTSPSQSQISSGIDIGRTTNGTVSYDLKIKARDLTQSLLVEWGSGSTGYSFNTSNLPTGVTYDSGTGKLTITKEAACGINGVNIPVVYTGNDTDEDAEGTIGISSSSGDGINVEVTLVANKLDTDGLIANWDAEDAPSSGAWVDRINSMKLNLGGTATKGNDGYRLDNTGAPKNAWLYLDSADKSTMNNLISKEFTCIVDCQVKFSATGMSANIIDFGNLGASLSNASIRAYVKQEGKLAHSLKQGDNAVSATVNNEQIQSFTTGSYIPMRIICGAKLVNGVQRFFARFGSAEVYSDLATPVVINFSGCMISNTVADYAFAAGIAYFSNTFANSDLSNYKADVIYDRILLFNKTLN